MPKLKCIEIISRYFFVNGHLLNEETIYIKFGVSPNIRFFIWRIFIVEITQFFHSSKSQIIIIRSYQIWQFLYLQVRSRWFKVMSNLISSSILHCSSRPAPDSTKIQITKFIRINMLFNQSTTSEQLRTALLAFTNRCFSDVTFRAHFCISIITCTQVLSLLENTGQIPQGAEPKHMLWVFFL